MPEKIETYRTEDGRLVAVPASDTSGEIVEELVAALEGLLSITYPPIGQDENGCLKRGADRPETIRARAVLVKAKREEVKDNG